MKPFLYTDLKQQFLSLGFSENAVVNSFHFIVRGYVLLLKHVLTRARSIFYVRFFIAESNRVLWGMYLHFAGHYTCKQKVRFELLKYPCFYRTRGDFRVFQSPWNVCRMDRRPLFLQFQYPY